MPRRLCPFSVGLRHAWAGAGMDSVVRARPIAPSNRERHGCNARKLTMFHRSTTGCNTLYHTAHWQRSAWTHAMGVDVVVRILRGKLMMDVDNRSRHVGDLSRGVLQQAM